LLEPTLSSGPPGPASVPQAPRRRRHRRSRAMRAAAAPRVICVCPRGMHRVIARAYDRLIAAAGGSGEASNQGSSTMIDLRRIFSSACCALLGSPGVALAHETCKSPYMPGLIKGQEDYLHVWTLGEAGEGD